ncbi:MAG: hypothetical protein AB7G93_05190 [Bdellovibrionales bacterium]
MDRCHKAALGLILIFVIVPSSALAQWAASFHHAGFLGDWAVGPAYAFHPKHSVELTVGAYELRETHYHQLNLGYSYLPWRVNPNPQVSWAPLRLGVVILGSLDNDRYFLKSPEQYPADNYYEQTAIRWGIQLGTSAFLARRRLELGLHTMILDSALVALYNNLHEDLSYFFSSGVLIKFHF